MKRRESTVAWLNQGFGHPSLDSFRPVLQRVGSSMLCTIFGGEISNRFAIGDLERSPPHLFLYLRCSKEKQEGTLSGLNNRESNFIK